MAHSNHVRAATFMCGAVLVFTLGDAVTKQITTSHATLAVLAVRCAFGVPIIMALMLIFKISPSLDVLRNKYLLIKAAIFALTIFFFAEALKVNTLTSFYLIFFLFLPIFAIGIDYFSQSAVPSKSYILIVCIMACFALYPNFQAEGFKIGREAIPVVVAAFFYASYLAYSKFIEDIADIDPLSSNLPSFLYGAIILGGFGIGGAGLPEYIGVFEDLYSLSLIFLAAFCSVIGIILITRATDYDTASKIAPYEYSVIVYAIAIDRFAFGVGISQAYWISAVGILVCSIALSIINDRDEKSEKH